MSQSTAVRTTAGAARTPQPRTPGRTAPLGPRLRVVSAPADARARPLVAVACLVLLVAGLVSVLLLNISLSHGSYEMYQLQQDRIELAEKRQALTEGITAAQAPQELASLARGLGMVPAPQAAFLHLSDGTVSGAAEPATAPQPPNVGNAP